MLIGNEFLKVSKLRQGRSPADGYARGWGLEFGGVRERLLNDENYRECATLADGRSVQSEERRMNLYLLLRFYLNKLPQGNVLELGSYRGGSACFMARAMQTYLPTSRFFALDTFEGMPYADRAIDAHSKGDFSGVDLDEIRSFAATASLSNLEFVKGRFEDTLPSLIDSMGPLALVHIDCDVRDAVAYSYEMVKDHMVPGGYVVFDDATVSSCIGATEVVEELVIQRDGLLSE